MDVGHLVKMANQIEQYFIGEGDNELAIAGIESHLRRFWEPRMRKAIIEHCAEGGEGLGEFARQAVERLGRSEKPGVRP